MKNNKNQILGKIGKTHKRTCIEGKLCDPTAFFEKLEQCKICKKIL